MCFDDFITIGKSFPSRSGLYATNIPGVTLALFDDLTKDEQGDYVECWNDLYSNAQANFIADVQGKLADKFHIDLKLVSRETSEFTKDENTFDGHAGLTLQYYLPKYAKLQVLTIEIFSIESYASPEFIVRFYKNDSSGELLYTKSVEIIPGRNRIDIFQDFEVDKLFISYSSADYRLYKSENRYYMDGSYPWGFDKFSCTFPICVGSNASVTQTNGGGLNADFVVYCSIEKFICRNLNIFKKAFLSRIGIDLIRERVLTDRFNRFTTLTTERATELAGYYQKEYDNDLENSVRNLRIQEDPICFECKSIVSSTNLLP
jgi:hypothetical protein